ncbi:hypothetical protein AALA54_08880 [Oscillospiraceae bacterium 44-34]
MMISLRQIPTYSSFTRIPHITAGMPSIQRMARRLPARPVRWMERV